MVCILYYIHTIMTHPKSADSILRQNFLRRFEKLWPAIKGSLAEVHKPCIRPNCAACARGDKHAAFILSFSDKGRRSCNKLCATERPLKACSTNWGPNWCVSTASSVTPRLKAKTLRNSN